MHSVVLWKFVHLKKVGKKWVWVKAVCLHQCQYGKRDRTLGPRMLSCYPAREYRQTCPVLQLHLQSYSRSAHLQWLQRDKRHLTRGPIIRRSVVFETYLRTTSAPRRCFHGEPFSFDPLFFRESWARLDRESPMFLLLRSLRAILLRNHYFGQLLALWTSLLQRRTTPIADKEKAWATIQ